MLNKSKLIKKIRSVKKKCVDDLGLLSVIETKVENETYLTASEKQFLRKVGIKCDLRYRKSC